jgi:hypothetical protein
MWVVVFWKVGRSFRVYSESKYEERRSSIRDDGLRDTQDGWNRPDFIITSWAKGAWRMRGIFFYQGERHWRRSSTSFISAGGKWIPDGHAGPGSPPRLSLIVHNN